MIRSLWWLYGTSGFGKGLDDRSYENLQKSLAGYLTEIEREPEMARFDDELIRRLKEEADIVRLIESYGTKLKDRGTNGEMIGLCPIHDDHEPSLVVNRQKNVWNCLGACGKGGDVIQWVMHAEKASFRHAVELLRDGATGTGGGKKFTTERKLECPLPTDADDQALLSSVVAYYHERTEAISHRASIICDLVVSPITKSSSGSRSASSIGHWACGCPTNKSIRNGRSASD